jgi:hypothetical protein
VQGSATLAVAGDQIAAAAANGQQLLLTLASQAAAVLSPDGGAQPASLQQQQEQQQEQELQQGAWSGCPCFSHAAEQQDAGGSRDQQAAPAKQLKPSPGIGEGAASAALQAHALLRPRP